MHSPTSTTSRTSRRRSERTSPHARRGTLPASPALLPEGEEIEAQAIVCRTLVAGCERALFELRCSLGRASEPPEVRAGLRAAELLESVLSGWCETLALLNDPVRS